jgi:soluble lytic murein transglycosylase-like protein
MQAAIEKQRASIRRQVAGSPSDAYFTTPWAGAPGLAKPVADGNCEPLPADQLRRLVVEASVREGINPMLVQAVIRRESGGKACAVSPKGAQGLMQLMPATQSDLGVRDPFDPAQNINGGARYLKQLLDRYKSDLRLTLAAYNAGPQRVEPGGDVPAIPETRAYVQAIMRELQAVDEPTKSDEPTPE